MKKVDTKQILWLISMIAGDLQMEGAISSGCRDRIYDLVHRVMRGERIINERSDNGENKRRKNKRPVR